jgi:hypothetical protein
MLQNMHTFFCLNQKIDHWFSTIQKGLTLIISIFIPFDKNSLFSLVYTSTCEIYVINSITTLAYQNWITCNQTRVVHSCANVNSCINVLFGYWWCIVVIVYYIDFTCRCIN